MMKFSGKPVYSGIVIGNVAVLRDSREQVRRQVRRRKVSREMMW